MRAVVVGASSGLGRCIGVGLAHRGAQVALLARRKDRLDGAVAEAGEGATAIQCDVTDAESVATAITASVDHLGGIDGLVYTPAIGPLGHLAQTDADTWRRVFDTNVVGAAITTAAALPHLTDAQGSVVYLSSVSASLLPPFPGLGAYAVSKAALDKLVEAWRGEHPTVNFTRCVVGDCVGGEGDSMTGFANDWDWDLAAQFHPTWTARGMLSGAFIDVEELVNAVDFLLHQGASVSTPSITLAPRPQPAS